MAGNWPDILFEMAVPIRLPAGYTLAAVAQTLLLLCTVCCALTDYDSKFSAAGFQQYVGNTTINVDLTKTHPVSDKLYGIFFEEVCSDRYNLSV